MTTVHQRALITATLAALFSVHPAAWPQDKPADNAIAPLKLFDGVSTYGWEDANGWLVQGGVLNAPAASDSEITSALPFGDFTLTFDYRLNTSPSSAFLRLRASHGADSSRGGITISLGDGKAETSAGAGHADAQHSAISANVWHTASVDADGSQVTVRIDGQPTASARTGANAGYLQLGAARGEQLNLRNISLKPLHLNPIFNGADLNTWKSVASTGKAGGLSHSLEKMLTLGAAGGPPKPHMANWTVRAGTLHGDDGPGSLETTAKYDNFVLQLTSSAQGSGGKQTGPAISIRNDAGKDDTGYLIGIGPRSGEIYDLAKPRKSAPQSQPVVETVVAGERSLGIFANGTLLTLYKDTRPEGATAKTGSRLREGTLSLDLPADVKAIDVRSIAIEPLKSIDGAEHLAPVADTTPAATTPAATTSAQTAQLAAALGTQTPEDRRKIAQLMSSALRTNDPQEQMRLYDQVVQLDPNNTAAVQGYRDAAARVERQQQEQQQQQAATQGQQSASSEREAQATSALMLAQSAFLAGNLAQTDASLRVAERLTPQNPIARDLRARLNAARSLRQRLLFLFTGGGVLLLAGSAAFFWRSRKQARVPVLRVIRGLEEGRQYPLDRPVLYIGGIAQDGDQKNDIVLHDVEHMISRFHCELHNEAGTFYLVDRGSANGTSVNGHRIPPEQPVMLRRGAKIDLGGSTQLEFALQRKPATPRAWR